MELTKLTIASRKSALALAQTELVIKELLAIAPHVTVDILPLSTKGDEILDRSVQEIGGGKGVFLTELRQALLNNEADFAVHSLKDMPTALDERFGKPILLFQNSPFDAFVSNDYKHPSEMPQGSKIGTSSLRRMLQLQNIFPHIDFIPIRGNVNTRLAKLDAQEFDGLVLAEAGLNRLNLTHRIKHVFTPNECIPAPGQGALAIETTADKYHIIKELFASLIETHKIAMFNAYRSMTFAKKLEAGCDVPLGVYIQIFDEQNHEKQLEKPLLWLYYQPHHEDKSIAPMHFQGEVFEYTTEHILNEYFDEIG